MTGYIWWNFIRPLKSCCYFLVNAMLFMTMFSVPDLTRFFNGKNECCLHRRVSVTFCSKWLVQNPVSVLLLPFLSWTLLHYLTCNINVITPPKRSRSEEKWTQKKTSRIPNLLFTTEYDRWSLDNNIHFIYSLKNMRLYKSNSQKRIDS